MNNTETIIHGHGDGVEGGGAGIEGGGLCMEGARGQTEETIGDSTGI